MDLIVPVFATVVHIFRASNDVGPLFLGRYQDISVLNICDISVLGTGHLGTQYWTSRYSVLKISVLNNKNNLIEFKNFLKLFFTCRRCLYKFLCLFLIIFN